MNLFELAQTADLPSLLNEETRAMSLYVMQNMHGLIKIGRSANPAQRQKQLRVVGQCAISLVAVFPSAGHFEELAHSQLGKHRVAFEWFCGDRLARRAVEDLFSEEFVWPFEYQQDAATAWIERQLDTGVDRYWRRRERRVIKLLKSAAFGIGVCAQYGEGHYQLDADIGLMVGYPTVCIDSRQGETIVTGLRGGDRKRSEVPRYTRSIDDAQTLWLPDVGIELRTIHRRPVDCCLAALCDRWGFAVERLEPAGSWK
ncbi:GIY-YIG nuclease family protein [Ralstonia pickettii]|nr:GIY-YIG nuclease family protein [Ralstonia pickettii]